MARNNARSLATGRPKDPPAGSDQGRTANQNRESNSMASNEQYNDRERRTVSDRDADRNLSDIDMLALGRNVEVVPLSKVPQYLAGTGKRAAVYARFSSAEQKMSSIERQVEICEAYLRGSGIQHFYVYADIAQSARWAASRASLTKLREDCENGLVDLVVTEDYDRLSREIYDAVEICEELEKNGIEFHSALEARKFSKEDVIRAAARAESDRVRRTGITSMGRRQLARKGIWPLALPFGYRKLGKGVHEPDPVTSVVVLRIYEMRDAGMGLRAIVKQLEVEGIAAPSGEVRWSTGSVQSILRNPLYSARIVYGARETVYDRRSLSRSIRLRPVRDVVHVKSETYRIVSDELWARVQRLRTPTGKRGTISRHILRGRAFCDCPGMTGNAFNAANGRLHCSSKLARDKCGSLTESSFSESVVEGAVLRAVVARLRNTVGDATFAEAVERSLREASESRDRRRAAVEKRLGEIDAELDGLLDAELGQKYGVERLERRRQALQEEERPLRAELRDLTVSRWADQARSTDRSFADLTSAVEGIIADRLPFVARTQAETELVQALRRLVRRVEIRRHGRPAGKAQLAIETCFAAYLVEEDGDADAATEILLVDVEFPLLRSKFRRMLGEIERLRLEGGHGLTDRQWSVVEGKLPDVVGRFPSAEGISMRQVADELVLRMRTGHPVGLAKDTGAMAEALRRLIYAKGDHVLLDTLRAHDPSWIAGLDEKALRTARSRWAPREGSYKMRIGAAASLARLDGSTALTDEAWAATVPLIPANVENPRNGRGGPSARLLIEGILLRLRARIAWSALPRRFGEPGDFMAAAKRLAWRRAWPDLLAMWGRRFPELTEGLDSMPMEYLPMIPVSRKKPPARRRMGRVFRPVRACKPGVRSRGDVTPKRSRARL